MADMPTPEIQKEKRKLMGAKVGIAVAGIPALITGAAGCGPDQTPTNPPPVTAQIPGGGGEHDPTIVPPPVTPTVPEQTPIPIETPAATLLPEYRPGMSEIFAPGVYINVFPVENVPESEGESRNLGELIVPIVKILPDNTILSHTGSEVRADVLVELPEKGSRKLEDKPFVAEITMEDGSVRYLPLLTDRPAILVYYTSDSVPIPGNPAGWYLVYGEVKDGSFKPEPGGGILLEAILYDTPEEAEAKVKEVLAGMPMVPAEVRQTAEEQGKEAFVAKDNKGNWVLVEQNQADLAEKIVSGWVYDERTGEFVKLPDKISTEAQLFELVSFPEGLRVEDEDNGISFYISSEAIGQVNAQFPETPVSEVSITPEAMAKSKQLFIDWLKDCYQTQNEPWTGKVIFAGAGVDEEVVWDIASQDIVFLGVSEYEFGRIKAAAPLAPDSAFWSATFGENTYEFGAFVLNGCVYIVSYSGRITPGASQTVYVFGGVSPAIFNAQELIMRYFMPPHRGGLSNGTSMSVMPWWEAMGCNLSDYSQECTQITVK